MRFLPGRLTFGQLAKAFLHGSNTGGAIVVTGADTNIQSINLGTIAEGDILLIFINIGGTKGGVAGDIDIRFSQTAGAAALLFYDQAGLVREQENMPALAFGSFTMAAIARCVTGGTCTVSAHGTSAGSNLTVGQDFAQLAVVIIAGN